MAALTVLLALILPAAAMAQVDITFNWDASPDAATAPANNPVKYRLLKCTDLATTICTVSEAGTALEFKVLAVGSGTYYFTARAIWFSLTVDGVPTGMILESLNSNILKVEVRIPPGNPKNTRVKITTIASTESGQTVGARIAGGSE